MSDSLGCTVFLPGASKVGRCLPFFANWPTLEAPGRKTVQPSESITEIKVVQNNIPDNFYFDLNNVTPKLKHVNFYFIKKQW